MHNALDAFASAYERFRLDLHYLIAQPMRAIVPFLAHRLDDRAYLQRVADCLKERVTGVADTLDWGACHGDTHGGNCHVAEDGTLILFDFDCCGPGWRAFDLATYRWETCLDKITDEPWTGFLEEYGKCRTLAESNLAAVPLFVALRHIWIMGLHTGNAHDWSHGWLTDRYFDRALKFLREWVDGQISDLFGVASGGTT
jgi:Ser/Thr protein kinase RdoA (MazF antagonist)